MQEQQTHNTLRILQVLPSLKSGGVERGTVDLALFLQQEKHIAFVASEDGQLVEKLKQKKINHFNVGLATKNPFLIFKNIFLIKKIIQEHKIDVIHARSRAPAWSAFFASKLANIPFVTTFHGTYNFSNTFLGKLKRWYNSIMVRGDYIIAISKFIQDHIVENYSDYYSDISHISLINRGVDLTYFNRQNVSQKQIQTLRKNWSIKKDDQVILIPGRLTRWKGQLVVLKALQKLIKANQNKVSSNIVCVFIGSDQGRITYTNELKAYVKKQNLDHHIRFVDNVNNMPVAYCVGDLIVHASTDPEAFGRVIIEAQAMEVPVIASNIGAPAKTIDHGKTGWLHKAGNPQDLSLKIHAALSTNNDLLIKKALDQVKKHYDDRLMFEKTISIYKKALEGSH